MTLLRKWKDRPQAGRKYLQITPLTKDLCPEHVKNPTNSKRTQAPSYLNAQRPDGQHAEVVVSTQHEAREGVPNVMFLRGLSLKARILLRCAGRRAGALPPDAER